MIKVAPSILSADFARLAEEVKIVEAGGADLIHVDVMDGHFVPNLTIGPIVVEALRKRTSLPLDVHLMIENPDAYIPDFIKSGADSITVHVEACTHLHRTVHLIKEKGVKVGVALNPATPLTSLQEIVQEIDMALLMSVNPGFGGQKFIPSVLSKIQRFRRILQDMNILRLEIEVDGGIKVDNAAQIALAGADILVAGSAVFGSSDPAGVIRKIKEACAIQV
ncbi:MAG TPA: ribulose-phosphate 3-epimerase [Candidatus Limnocylindrales bacterium]|nr:ribulose-phosphate 3-epimerase [Candidatus Limnocylindrales bacterium]